jgi:D-glycero-alpha-D-manno-heptose 1-phosphate guanylyltransferase
MKILVLAGGVGSRLKSVVSDVPKALAPIGGVPFLHLQLEAWIEQGAKSFVFLLGYRADLILAFLHKYESTLLNGCEVRYVIETTPLNTGGAVAF